MYILAIRVNHIYAREMLIGQQSVDGDYSGSDKSANDKQELINYS